MSKGSSAHKTKRTAREAAKDVRQAGYSAQVKGPNPGVRFRYYVEATRKK